MSDENGITMTVAYHPCGIISEEEAWGKGFEKGLEKGRKEGPRI